MTRFVLLLAIVLPPPTILAQSHESALRVRFSIVERSGIDRIDEPVTFGVPLPEGRLIHTSDLLLLDEYGHSIPASFRVAQKWLGGSIRWLHVHSLISISANKGRSLTLVEDKDGLLPKQAPRSPLEVEEAQNRVSIRTGPVKLVLSALTPGVFESVYYSPSGRFESDSQVLIDADAGTSIRVAGQSFNAVYPGSGRIEVLDCSPMHAVVLISGKFAGDNNPLLSFEARAIVYAGSPRVAMDYTIVNRTGKVAANRVDLEDLSLVFKVPLSKPSVTIGGADSEIVGELRTEGAIFQDTSDHYTIEMNGKTIQ
jgi:hypothetical protein